MPHTVLHSNYSNPGPGFNRNDLGFRVVRSVESKGAIVTEAGKLLYIDGGSFTMGSSNLDMNNPRVPKTVSDFYMGETEVTQEQYEDVTGKPNPSLLEGVNNPVERVNWNDAVEFCNALSAKEGITSYYVDRNGGKASGNEAKYGYRLATEAEWEYVARGGENHTYSGSGTIGDVAWWSGNSGYKTHTVGKKDVNGYGLHVLRVIRGGSWCHAPSSGWFLVAQRPYPRTLTRIKSSE